MSETSIAGLTAHLPSSATTIAVINPANAKRIYDLPQLTVAQVEIEADRARDAQPAWAALPTYTRAKVLGKLHDLLLANETKLLDLLQLETGKARSHAFEELAGALGAARYYAKVADKALSVKKTVAGVPVMLKNFVSYAPVGLVGVITPWNYPLALAAMDVLPALVAGNSVLHKVDNQTALVSLFLRHLAVEAGLPEDVWRIVVGDGAEVGNAVTDNVDYVAFTGSTKTGRVVAQRAAVRLIGCSLELGGKNPLIILPGANLNRAAEVVIAGSFGNSGQLCVSIERVYVHSSMKQEFETVLAERVRSLKVGRSSDFDFDMGTLTGEAQLNRVKGFVDDAVQHGAKVLAGGHALTEVGPYFYEPTVLTEVTENMRLAKEEVFGPVISLTAYDTIAEAIVLANDTDYGLNASVVGPKNEAMKVALQLQAGSVNINEGYRASMASFDSPMGGMKQSGQGRRGGINGLLRFTEARTIGIAQGPIKMPSRARQWVRMAPLMNLLAKILK